MPRRVLIGDVVSDKQNKTITVLVERRYMHPVYKKYVKRSDKYAAHDELNQFKTGDRVEIIECRPISRKKRWTVVTNEETAKKPSIDKTSKKQAAAPAAKKEEKKEKAPAKKPVAKAKKGK